MGLDVAGLVNQTIQSAGFSLVANNPLAQFGTLPAREYKLLSSRDKCFEGKFDLARMEDALNQLARLGWTARSMTTTHLKGYTGAMEEVIVVLLERSRDAI